MHIEQSQVFAALSNQLRLRCLYLVAKNGEVCVCEVVEALGVNQPTASKALGGLKAAGLVRDRREANWNYYSLRDDMPDWVNTVVCAAVDELTACSTCIADENSFKRLVERPGNVACQ